MTMVDLWRVALAAALLLLAAYGAQAAGDATNGGADGPAATAADRGPVTHLPLPRFVSMRSDTANVRRGPSLDQRVDWEFVHRGLPLEITAEYGQWRRVRDADGAGGWIHSALLSGVRTALVQGTAAVPLRAGPDDATAVRAMAEPGVVGRLRACEGAWCEISAEGIEGWLPRVAIWGVGPDETVE
jgi:SH3-like domain-containing protein